MCLLLSLHKRCLNQLLVSSQPKDTCQYCYYFHCIYFLSSVVNICFLIFSYQLFRKKVSYTYSSSLETYSGTSSPLFSREQVCIINWSLGIGKFFHSMLIFLLFPMHIIKPASKTGFYLLSFLNCYYSWMLGWYQSKLQVSRVRKLFL